MHERRLTGQATRHIPQFVIAQLRLRLHSELSQNRSRIRNKAAL